MQEHINQQKKGALLSEAEKDRISIKRAALLAKKRILDQIELLHEKGAKVKKELLTKRKFLAEVAEITEFIHFKNILEGIENDGVLKFEEYGEKRSNWKFQELVVRFNDEREAYTQKVREEYYEINQIYQNFKNNFQPKEIQNVSVNPKIQTTCKSPNKSFLAPKAIRHWIGLVALIVPIAGFFGFQTIQDFLPSWHRKPVVTISEPIANSTVSGQTDVRGTVKDLKDSETIWVYVYSRRDISGKGAYYLDPVSNIDRDRQTWWISKNDVFVGANDSIGKDYIIGTMILSNSASEQLKRTYSDYLKTPFEENQITPLRLDCNCKQITVIRN